MNFWQRATNAVRSIGQRLSDPRRLLGRGGGWWGMRSAGEWVTENTAYNLSTVYACVRLISSLTAQLPWQAYYTDPVSGNRVRLLQSPVDRLLHKRPHPEVGSFTFRELMLSRALLHGNAYAEIVRNYQGDATQLCFIEPGRVSPQRDESGVLGWRVSNDAGGDVWIPDADMFHLRGLGNEVEGWSVLEMARRSLGISLASEGMAESAMRNNPRLNLVFKHPKSLSDDAYRRLKDDLDERTQPSAAHKPLLLEDGVDFEALRLNPNDLQLLESRKFQAEEICRWFGLPPHKVALLDRATFSNIESQAREALTDCIMPWVLRLEQEADEKLFRRSHKAMGAYSKMNTNALLRSDAAGRAQLYKALHAVGAISPDEIAELEDLPKIGAERGGNLRVIPMNMQTLEAAMAAAKSTAKRK